MAISQPYFETVVIPPGRSLLVFERQLHEFPFNWHYHPEFELTLTVNSSGMRFVGDDIAHYGDDDLVLIAPNLPHAFQSQSLIGKATEHRATICWFTQEWARGLIDVLPELAPVGSLLEQARRGLHFGSDTSTRLRGRMLQLGQMDAPTQIIALQSLLVELAAAPDCTQLASGESTISDLPRDRLRMQRILNHLHSHYEQPLRLKPLCYLAHLTESQLQRIFKRSTRMSISAYVGQLRLGRACQMLVQTERPIGQIATECGFSDAADFARRFRKARGLTPSAYRMTSRRT